ncbi:RadC family protein [Chitinophaga sp. LS1]|uniref:RadC family protein n=1 Tax=Chitinophaga sp. LS1 TaxID=3051176 RepID=UPI002AAB0488|nr:DNA repair protein RadC [Chitinophaga sp. LS1]WPV70602.1 DNA repair protein RadC [Chitinophaga sp. LS1]
MKSIVDLDQVIDNKMVNVKSSLSMSRWPIDDLPHQKLINHGPSSLTDTELLALVIGTGSKGNNVNNIAKELLAKASYSLSELAKFNVNQFKRIRGIGDIKAAELAAVMELGRRRQAGLLLSKKVITNTIDAVLYFKPILGDQSYESFHVLYMNHGQRVLKHSVLAKGGIANVSSDTRMILREALEIGASKLILCHNHPSGNLNPSSADKYFTEKIVKAASLMDIAVIDHIIVSEVGFYSLADEGSLN